MLLITNTGNTPKAMMKINSGKNSNEQTYDKSKYSLRNGIEMTKNTAVETCAYVMNACHVLISKPDIISSFKTNEMKLIATILVKSSDFKLVNFCDKL